MSETKAKTNVRITPMLPEGAYQDLATWRQSGKVAFARVIEQLPESECKNCGGWGRVMVSFCSKGPTKMPISPRQPSTYFSGNGQIGKGWYLIENTVTYECPKCGGQ